MALDPKRVEEALRQFIACEVDYDIHKNFESDEETGEDCYSELAEAFIAYYEESEEDECVGGDDKGDGEERE